MIRRPDHRRVAAAIAARLVVGFLLLLLGCAGGSGSSGFDLAENSAITQALDEERCIEGDGLTICPANGAEPSALPSPTATLPPAPTSTATDTSTPPPTFTSTPPFEDHLTPTPTSPTTHPMVTPTDSFDTTATPTRREPTTGTPTPTQTGPDATRPVTRTASSTPTPALAHTPTPTPSPTPTIPAPVGMRIDTSLGDASAVDCSQDGRACGFPFFFAPQGFAPDTTFQVAARRRDPDGEWRIFLARQANADPTMPIFEAFVSLPTESGRNDPFLAQIAVLVFLEPTVPASAAVDSLAETSAAFAFVTREVQVVPGP